MTIRALAMALGFGAVMAAGAVSAASFAVVPGTPLGDPGVLPSTYGSLRDGVGVAVNPNVNPFKPFFDDESGVKQVNPGSTPVTTFDSGNAATGGLFLSGTGTVTFSYLGSEANFENTTTEGEIMMPGTSLFNNKSTPFGTQFSFFIDQGNNTSLLPFFFQTGLGLNALKAENGGPIDFPLLLSFTQVFNNGRSVIAFFEDKGGNALDLDDMVIRIDVVPIPLPAGVLLFGTALAGMGLLGRRRVAAVA